MAKKENSKENKHFFKDFKAEIKKVIWPSTKQLLNTTVAIITMIIVVAAIVFILDFAFEALNKHGLTKLQQSAMTTTTNNTSDNENEASDSSETETQVETTVDDGENTDTTQVPVESEE